MSAGASIQPASFLNFHLAIVKSLFRAPALRGVHTVGATFAAWLLAVCLGLAAPPARAEGIDLQQFSTHRVEDGLELSFSTRFELSKSAEEALHKGVALYFVAEAQLLRYRWYWRDNRVAKSSRTWRLAWQPLTRQYRVSTGGLTQSFSALDEALGLLRGVAGWRIAEPREIEDDGRYSLEFSYRLDTSQLPRPMQIGLGSIPGFSLSVERSTALNADFSLRAGQP